MLSCCGWTGTLLVGYLIYRLFDMFFRSLRIGKYDQRYILVTGCDTGFGNLLCRRLDSLGCHVFAGCYTEAGIQELTKACSVRIHALPLDVTKPESVKEAFHTIKAKLPQGRGLWGVMNNAGLMGSMGPPEWQTMSDYKLVSSVNLFGLIDTTMTFLPLVKIEKGRVVSTASIVGRVSSPTCIPYCVTKFGVEGFMDGLRRAIYQFGVKCSIIEPGIHNTTFWQKTSTTEAVKHTVAKSWDELSPDNQKEFGKDYYDKIIPEMVVGSVKFASTRFEDVVDAYEHALLAVYPRPRYMVGWDARIIGRLLIHAPEWFSDGFGRLITKDYPIPAALRK